MSTTPQASYTRRDTIAALSASGALAALPGCASVPAVPPAPASPEGLLDELAWNLLEKSPVAATALALDVGEKAYLRGQSGDVSAAGQKDLAAMLHADLARVRAVDTAPLDPATRTSFEVVESAYATSLDGLALPYGEVSVGGWRNSPYVVIQNVGAYLDYPRFMDADQPVNSAADAEAWLSRLTGLPAIFDGELERMRSAREMGAVPPDFLLDKAIAQLDRTLAEARKGDLMATEYARKAEAANLGAQYAARARMLVAGPVAAALDRQLAELRRQRAVADSDPGLWSQPRGDEWYAWALRAATTTRLSPDEIHQLGLEELEALHARMDPILRKIGYTSGSVGERMTLLADDPRYKFAPGDAGRAEIMAFIRERIDWIRGQMPRAFHTLVDPRVEVRRLPLAEEPGAPGAYGGAGSKDGSIPGRMWINLHSTDLHRKYDLADLTYHETIPGHVWQGEYSHRLPLIRSLLGFSAYTEGWALYAEQLADELGAYEDFPVGRLGYLQSLAFRACRMVVDTGLHSRRWNRAQAVEFFVTRNGSKPDEVASEVDRYCSWPGQACGYKMGHSEIVALRLKAQQALGARFDVKRFNDTVIIGGDVPLDVLGRTVDRYIAAA